MNKFEQPLDYAMAACDTMMRKFKAEDLPPKGRFHYHQGVFLSGMYKTYELCKEEKYYDYIKEWVDSAIDEDGKVKDCDERQLDDIQPGILLFPIYKRTADLRYKKVLDRLLEVVKDFPRNPEGGFWHKEWYPNQMWLDGLYMAGPISAQYGYEFNKKEYHDIVIQQATMMIEKTRDHKTGLLYHAWDYSKKEAWADKETGLSPEFWGRSIGWVPVALLDNMDFFDKNDSAYKRMEAMVKDLLSAVCKYQSESGLWYQVVDKILEEGNWPEISCSCLFVAALCKAVRIGILDKEYLEQAKKGYEAVINTLTFIGDDIQIDGVCIGTGVGDYKHYIERPTSANDLHGVGAFLIMCEEVHQVL